MDLATKVDLILFEMISSLFWSSFVEILAFTIALILFLNDSTEMASIWWFLPHVFRGVTGYLLLKGLPTTHGIIKNASISPDE